jgi:predicted metal-dependent hydrolase
MFSFEYESKVIEYQIIRSNRKTVTISILPTKKVEVGAPKYLSDKEIMHMVKNKASWIIKKLEEMPDALELQEKRKYEDGDKLLYRGKEYELRIIMDSKIKNYEINIERDKIVAQINPKNKQAINDILEAWYKQRAKEFVYDRIKYYNSFLQKNIRNVRIKDQKKRWGSCSNLGNLNFNWRIIMMPEEMFDYIIVHELCHLKFLNHSKAYWKSVEEILPDYKEREKWIKLNAVRFVNV